VGLVATRYSELRLKHNTTGLSESFEDALVFLFSCGSCIFRSFFSTGSLGEHRRNHPGTEQLVNRSRGVSRITDIGGPVRRTCQNLVFVLRMGAIIVRDFLLAMAAIL